MSIRKELLTSALSVLGMIVVLGLLYPLVITGISQVAFPGNANGQRVYVDGSLVGSKIIGQSFAQPVHGHGSAEVSGGPAAAAPDPRYFQSRPSGDSYDDEATGFANYGPNSIVTEKAIAANIAAYIALNGRYYPGALTAGGVPVDAADTSASGVDPDISVANAHIQAYRVASVRHLSVARVDALVAANTSGRGIGFSGEPGVDVLELNVALDRLRFEATEGFR
jgi:K+-transporting ATPase ATPase C chain